MACLPAISDNGMTRLKSARPDRKTEGQAWDSVSAVDNNTQTGLDSAGFVAINNQENNF